MTCPKEMSMLGPNKTPHVEASYARVRIDKPAMARPHWSRSQATAHARVLPVVGLVVTKRTKSALATPSANQNRFR
jgi:hypothetical protein